MQRFCANPGCKKIVPRGYCSDCKRENNRARDKQRGTAHQRGLGYEYQKARYLILKDDDICHICGLSNADTVDHIIPRSAGGTNDMDNLAPAHAYCNYSRGNKPLDSGE